MPGIKRTRSGSRVGGSSTVKRTRTTSAKRKPLGRGRAVGTFAKRVRTILHKEAETKLKVVTFLDNEGLSRSGLKTTTNNESLNGISIINLWGQSIDHPGTFFFKMERGTEQEQFIGNQISNAVMDFRGFVVSKPFDATHNNSPLPYEFHILVYRNKLTPANGNPNGLLSKPDNTVGDITGRADDTMMAWNKDAYIIKKHMVLRMRPRSKTFENVDAIQNGDLSNAPVFRRFGFRLKLPKVIKIPDAETYAQAPTANWSLGFYVVDGSGLALAANQSRCAVSLVGSLRFKDY